MPAPAPTARPEQVGVVLRAGRVNGAVGGDDLDLGEAVAGEPVRAHEHAHPAAEGESGDADRRAGAAGQGTPRGADAVVDLRQGRTRPDRHGVVGGETDGRHAAGVDHQRRCDPGARGPAGRISGIAVATRSQRDGQVVPLREGERGGDIGCRTGGEHRQRARIVPARILGEPRHVVRRVTRQCQ